MSKIRLIVLGALAVLAVSAVASASASAEACAKEEGKKTYILCLGTLKTLTVGTLTIHVKTDKENIIVLKGLGIELLGKVVTGLGALTSSLTAGATKVTQLVLSFSTIKVDGIANCKVAEPLNTVALTGTITGKEKVEFTPSSGSVFATVKFENNGGTCLIAGSDTVSVKTAGKGPVCTASEAVAVEQLFTCPESESLLLGGEKASFGGDFNVTLLKAGVEESWSVVEGK